MTKFLSMEDLVNKIEKERPDIIEELENTELEHEIARQMLERRRKIKMSQEQLMRKARLTQCQISRVENGYIKSFSTFRKMVEALGLEVKLVPKAQKKGQINKKPKVIT